ncbi:sulfatase [Crateriforma spongiae]|uniref:sulfatase n=1 Tax=Crateriforma spongiae TaxID=2724528 RepID=UPI001447831A|nr:sulfatase [Crateriforma spongiae]
MAVEVFVRWAGVFTLAVPAFFAPALSIAESNLPPTRDMNLLMITVEDWAANAIGAYGNPVVQTPHVDSLAKRGVTFDRAYCQATVCNPSRASFVTGMRPDYTQVFRNSDSMDDLVPADAPSMARILDRDDVFAAQFGKLVHKWDDAGRFAKGFDLIEYTHDYDQPPGFEGTLRRSPAGPAGIEDVEMECLEIADKTAAARLKRLWDEREEKLAAGAENNWTLRKPFQQLFAEQVGDSGIDEASMEDGRLVRSAAKLLGDLAESKQKFFLNVGLYSTHTPLLAPKKYVEAYPPSQMLLTPATRNRDYLVPDVARRGGKNYDIFNGLYPEYGPTNQRQREAVAAYYACSSYVDASIGVLLNKLVETGLDQNTIIVFFADHGFQLGEHGCWSKFTLFEQSTRVPMIVVVPGMKHAGDRCGQIVELVDVLPTLCDLWEIPKDSRFEGDSFVPLLASPDRPWKTAAYSCITLGGLGRSVRTKDYRYAEYHRDVAPPTETSDPHAVELYDMRSDPWEQNNLAGRPAFESVQQQMRDLLISGTKSINVLDTD